MLGLFKSIYPILCVKFLMSFCAVRKDKGLSILIYIAEMVIIMLGNTKCYV